MSSGFSNRLFLAMTVLVIACWVFITFLSQQPGHFAVFQFLLAAAVMFLATAFVVWQCFQSDQTIPLHWLLGTALLLRLISLFGLPLFEDDYYRYLWDGYQTVTTHDPYSLAPAVFFDREDYPEIFDSILSLINYPDIATVYGPVTQWIFALGYLIAPAEIWPLQLSAGLADLAVLAVLYKLGAGRALLFYAWSPLLLKEFALTAHPDIYAILAMVLCVYLVSRNIIWLAGIVLALGVGSKVFAILVLPYLLCQRWSIRYWTTLCGWFAATLAAITLAFGTITIWAPEGLQAMADSWLFNSATYLLLLKWFSFEQVKLLLLFSFVAFNGLVCLRSLMTARWMVVNKEISTTASHELKQVESDQKVTVRWIDSRDAFRGDWLFMAFLLALPVVNAWYVAWLLPFATLFPRWWSWLFSWFCLLSYCTGTNLGRAGDGSLELPVSIIFIEYSAVVGLAVMAFMFCTSNTKKFAGL